MPAIENRMIGFDFHRKAWVALLPSTRRTLRARGARFAKLEAANDDPESFEFVPHHMKSSP
jgi:hypothetical protein